MDFFSKSNPFIERVKSPLYGSFVVSWAMWNWRVFFSIFLLDRQDYKGQNAIDFISENYLNWNTGFWFPLITAIIYILVIPWVDYLFVWHAEFNKRKKVERKIKVGRKHPVEGEIYYALLAQYDEEKQKIYKMGSELRDLKEELRSVRNAHQQEMMSYQRIEIELTQAIQEKTAALKTLTKLEKRHDAGDFFKGRWTLDYYELSGGISQRKAVNIEVRGTEIFYINATQESKAYSLELVDFDPDKNHFSFLKYSAGNQNVNVMSVMKIINNDLLEGSENGQKAVYMRNRYSETN